MKKIGKKQENNQKYWKNIGKNKEKYEENVEK